MVGEEGLGGGEGSRHGEGRGAQVCVGKKKGGKSTKRVTVGGRRRGKSELEGEEKKTGGLCFVQRGGGAV